MRKPGDLFGRESGSRPVSRVLSWTAIHLGRWSPIASCSLPADSAGRLNVCLFGLAPDGVCHAIPVARNAVSSYLTRLAASPTVLADVRAISTLPDPVLRPAIGGVFSVALSVALGRGLASSAYSAQALPGILPYGARTFLCVVTRAAAVWPTPGRQYRGRCPL